jgi:arylsulfatase A-like enzyme
VIHWLARVKARGEIRSQFTDVSDIAPTVLEAAGLPFPKTVNGTTQKPFDGTSVVYTFDNPKANEIHTTQYFEMFGDHGTGRVEARKYKWRDRCAGRPVRRLGALHEGRKSPSRT